MQVARALSMTGALVVCLAVGVGAGTNDSFNTTLISNLPYPGATDCTAQGDLVFVGLSSGSVAIVDVSVPATPVERSQYAISDIGGARVPDVRVAGNMMWAANEPYSGKSQGLYGVDITNPDSPVEIAVFGPDNGGPSDVHNLFAEADYLYVSGHSAGVTGNLIVDVTTPSLPTLVANENFEIHDSGVVGDTWYIAGGFTKTAIYDVTDRTAPSLITEFTSNDIDNSYYSHNIWPIRDTDHVVVTHEVKSPGFGFEQGDVRIWDVSVPASPVELLIWQSENMMNDPNITPHNAFVVGDFMYLSHYQDGVKVFDITDPTAPVEVGYYDTFPQTPTSLFEGAWGVDANQGPGRIFVSDRTNGFFHVSFNSARKTRISGQVLDAATLDPIPGATVYSSTANRTVNADFGGNYDLSTGAATHDFEVSADGYSTLNESVVLADNGDITHDFLLDSNVVSVPGGGVSSPVMLHEAAPNPFNPSTTLGFEVAESLNGAPATLRIYDVRGNLVRTLLDGPARAGAASIEWDGRNDIGVELGSGIFHARFTVGSETRTQKLVLTK